MSIRIPDLLSRLKSDSSTRETSVVQRLEGLPDNPVDVYLSGTPSVSLIKQGLETNLQRLKVAVAKAFNVNPFLKDLDPDAINQRRRREVLQQVSSLIGRYSEGIKKEVAKQYLRSSQAVEQIIGVVAAGLLENQNEEKKQLLLSQFYFSGSPVIKALTIQTAVQSVKAESVKAELLKAFAESEDCLELRRLLVTQAGFLHKYRDKIGFLKFFLTDLDPNIVETARTQLKALERHLPIILTTLKEPYKREHLQKTQAILEQVLSEYRGFLEDQQAFFELQPLVLNIKKLSAGTPEIINQVLTAEKLLNAVKTIQSTRRGILTRLKSKNNQKKYPLTHRFLQKALPKIRDFTDQIEQIRKQIEQRDVKKI